MIFTYTKNKSYNILFLVLFFFILFLGSGATNIFNGLPWINKYETILIIIILPIILLLNFDIFNKLILRLLLIILILLKLILIWAPQIGIGHKIYYKSNDYDQNEFIKTYSNFWQDEFSEIQEFDWNIKENFPLDWVNFDETINSTGGLQVNNNKNYTNLNIISKIDFFLFVPEKSKIKIFTEGAAKKSKLFVSKIDTNEETILYLDNENNFFYEKDSSFFSKGIYHFKGEINYLGDKWSFVPQISSKNNKFESALNKRIIFLSDKKLNTFSLSLFILIGKIYDFFIFTFIILSIVYLILDPFKKSSINNEIIGTTIFFLLFLFSNVFLNFVIENFHGLWPLCLTFILFTIIITFDHFIKRIFFLDNLYKHPIKYLIFVTTPTFFYLGIDYYSVDLENTSFWSRGDDWHIFQQFSREIVVNTKWVEAGEQIFYFRPGIRYFFAIMHVLFGQSAFAIKIAEFWVILCSSMLVISFLRKLNISIYLSVVAGMTLMIFFLGENFRWIIGRGLSEYYGMILILISSYILLNNNLKNYYQIFLIGLVGIIAAWIREEKVLVVLSLIFLANNIDNKKISNFWLYLIYFFKKNYKQVIFYWTVVIIGFPILFETRNYLVGGGFSILGHPSVASEHVYSNLHSFYQMIFATPWPPWLYTPRLTPIFLVSSFLTSILLLIYPRIYRHFPYPGLGIIILAIVLPTIPFLFPGYVPRHSIYLLPYGIIFFFILINKIFGKKIDSLALR